MPLPPKNAVLRIEAKEGVEYSALADAVRKTSEKLEFLEQGYYPQDTLSMYVSVTPETAYKVFDANLDYFSFLGKWTADGFRMPERLKDLVDRISVSNTYKVMKSTETLRMMGARCREIWESQNNDP